MFEKGLRLAYIWGWVIGFGTARDAGPNIHAQSNVIRITRLATAGNRPLLEPAYTDVSWRASHQSRSHLSPPSTSSGVLDQRKTGA